MKKKGLLFIISGPAGSGKGTIVKRVRELAEFDFSVSATTRSPRPGELEGVHYFFVGKQEFEEKIKALLQKDHISSKSEYSFLSKYRIELNDDTPTAQKIDSMIEDFRKKKNC